MEVKNIISLPINQDFPHLVCYTHLRKIFVTHNSHQYYPAKLGDSTRT